MLVAASDHQMRFSPAAPLLVVGVLGAIAVGTHLAVRNGHLGKGGARRVYGLLGLLLAWAAASALLAYRGAYLDPQVLQSLPYTYLPFVPFAIVFGGLALSAELRRAVQSVLRHAPLYGLVFFHAIRVTGIGSIIKLSKGELPAHFILPVGVPDLLVGLTAVILGIRLYKRRPVSHSLLVGWNAFGVALFLSAPVVLHLSLPGPLQIYFDGPTTAEVFEFPMALVPTFLVPMFMLMHIGTIWKLRTSHGESTEPRP